VKLSGWKRIGFVASVLWAIGVGLHVYENRLNSFIVVSQFNEDVCLEAHSNDTENHCFADSQKYVSDMLPGAELEAAIYALVPVPLGWGFVYLVLFVVRWVKRGFLG
jgi:hypothetical protein